MTGCPEKKPGPGGLVQRLVYFLVKNSALVLMLVLNRLQTRMFGQGQFDGARLFVSNHQSNMDPPLIGGLIPCQSSFLAKKELFSIPLIGWVITKCNGIPLDRKGIDREGLRRAVDALKGGGKLLIFPEGRRTRDGQLQPGKPGAGMIGAMAGVKCVPIYIDGTGKAMPVGGKVIRPHKVRVGFGEPFSLPERPEGSGSKEYYQLCADMMMERIAQVRSRLLGCEEQNQAEASRNSLGLHAKEGS